MLTVQDDAVQTLTGLGLTVLQAKVYLALAHEGKSTVKDLAKTSKVARQDIYRITTELLNMGVIEKLVDTPTKFNAIPTETAVDMLIERRKKETTQLERQATEFLESFAANEEAESKDKESQFTIMSSLQTSLKKAKRQILNAKKSIKVATTSAFFSTYALENAKELAEALKKGVNIQIVTQKTENIGKPPKKLQTLMNHPLFQIRHASLPSSMVAIFDGEEVNIAIQPSTTPLRTEVLTSNNPSLIELAENYFEALWNSYRLSNLLLNAIPYPAMLIQQDRIVIAANKIALEMGAKIGEPCWREFAKSMFVRDGESKCWYCMADEAMCENAEKHCDVEAFGRLWDVWWIPVQKEIFLHFAIDITKSKQI